MKQNLKIKGTGPDAEIEMTITFKHITRDLDKQTVIKKIQAIGIELQAALIQTKIFDRTQIKGTK